MELSSCSRSFETVPLEKEQAFPHMTPMRYNVQSYFEVLHPRGKGYLAA